MKWLNPYIEKVTTLPEFLLGAGKEFTEADREALRTKQSEYRGTIIELGSGSGKHLLERSALDPQRLYVGFELRFKRAFRTAEKAKEKALTNVLVLKTKAEIALELFADSSLDGIYCNFPDPWSKQHWQKHRMLRAEILLPLLRKLRSGCFFAFKTDHAEYYRSTLAILEENSDVSIESRTDDLHKSPENSNNVLTEFECLFRSKQLPTYYLRAVRKL